MTDPFDFESRLGARLTAHAARASRPFDASSIATAAASTPQRGVAFGPLARSLSGRDGRLSTLRVAFTVLLLAAVVTAGTILVGAALRGQPPLPDRLSVVAPTESAAATPILEDRPTPVPEETPSTSPQAVPATPAPPTNKLLFTDQGPKRCGTRVHSIDVSTGTTSQPIAGCFLDVWVAPDGRHVLAGGGTGYDTGDGIGFADPADQNRFTMFDLSTGSGSRMDGVQQFGWSPDGRWMLYNGVVGPTDGSSWTTLPRPLTGGTSCAPCWSPDGSYLAIRTDDGLVIGEGSGAGMHLVPTIPSIWSWSHDGRRVAWVKDGDAWVANVDGSDARNITTFDQPGVAGVAISPDGATVAVRVGLRTIYMIYPDGSHEKFDLGANLPDGEVLMQWAATGRWLTISAPPPEGPGTGTTILMSAAGTVVARVAAWHVSWAPDGSQVAVSVTPWDLDPQSTTAKTPKAKGTTYLLWLDGSSATLADAWSPVWSPDSRSLALVSGTPTSPKLQVAASDGSHRQTLPTGDVPGIGDVTWVR